MKKKTKNENLDQMKSRISGAFKRMAKNVWLSADLRAFLKENAPLLGLTGQITTLDLIEFLSQKKIVTEETIVMPLGKEVTRYITETGNVYELALTLKRHAYLCHYTAMFLHGLTDNIPKTIYSNTELKPSNNYNSNELKQDAIDRAFANNMRQSNQIAKYKNLEIYLLNSKSVDQVGVKDFDFNGVKLRVTDIERTLIDITVRPNYAGGTEEVLNAYKAAKNKVSVNRLLATLKKLDYTYPYHQSIGFYLERAGYDESVLDLIEKIEIKYNFYLTYKIKDKDYSARWKLFFPRGL
ncbi:MAG TPA: hypothetical protein DCG57_09890 [Candidatus Riflebacteria bacterium]|jgi:predicted transcriptional regulator of viral defense system|nr:hypothetical protein [Clostridia bacterium]HAE38935.1 hypothetical protein [Candidatus Riflebacteria bacterium]